MPAEPVRRDPLVKYAGPELTLRARPLTQLAWAGISGVLCLAGVGMVRDGQKLGFFVGSFFGLCALVFMVQVLPSASYLRLTSDGFELCSMFRTSMFRWDDVAEFQVGRIGRATFVVFEFAPAFTGQRRARGLARALAGYEAALPDTYGRRADELASILNDWKRGLRSQDR